MHLNTLFILCHLYFLKQNWLKPRVYKHTFERINELFSTSIFQDHILLIFMRKMRPEKQVQIIESPDNRGPDNQGSTVLGKKMGVLLSGVEPKT